MAGPGETRDRFVLGVDLDGVGGDFYGGLRLIAAEWFGVPLNTLTESPSYGLPEWNIRTDQQYEDLHRFAVTQRNLFRDLRPVAGAPATLRRISEKNIRIRVITHRLYIKYFHEEAVTQTTSWLEHHGIPYWDLCFMKDKAAVGADLYIEDSPSNVKRLRDDAHPTIVFTNSTNRELESPRADSWEDVERLVDEAHKKWKKEHPKRHIEGR